MRGLGNCSSEWIQHDPCCHLVIRKQKEATVGWCGFARQEVVSLGENITSTLKKTIVWHDFRTHYGTVIRDHKIQWLKATKWFISPSCSSLGWWLELKGWLDGATNPSPNHVISSCCHLNGRWLTTMSVFQLPGKGNYERRNIFLSFKGQDLKCTCHVHTHLLGHHLVIWPHLAKVSGKSNLWLGDHVSS